MRSSWKASAGLVVIGALLPLGLTACTAPTSPLTCSAAAATAKPAQNTTELITIKTVSGAVAVTKAGASPVNAHGVVKVAYKVASAKVGVPVKFAVKVVKGSKTGVCSASFTPIAAQTTLSQPGTSQPITTVPAPVVPALLQATIVPTFGGPALGSVLPPSCSAPHGDNGCGSLSLDVTIGGFNAYGGIPACPAGELGGTSCYEPTWYQALTGTVSLAWTLTCSTDGGTISGSAVATAHVPYPGFGQNYVNQDNRVDANTDQPHLVVDLPLQPDAASKCAGKSTLVSVKASNIALHLQGPASAFPTSDFSAAGPFFKSQG